VGVAAATAPNADARHSVHNSLLSRSDWRDSGAVLFFIDVDGNDRQA